MSNQNAVNATQFQSLDLGTGKPTSVPVEVVEVKVEIGDIASGFAKAFVNEAYRKAPLRAEQVNLSQEELEKYLDFLLQQRVLCVEGKCELFRKLKVLYIPSFVQYVLSLVGTVTMRDIGLTIRPVFEHENVISYEEALAISEKVGSFIDDLQIVQDAMPRTAEGNQDVMSTALIAGYVRAIKPVQHVVATYVSAFLNFQLRKETAFQTLYRVQYDDVSFIASAFTTQKGLY